MGVGVRVGVAAVFMKLKLPKPSTWTRLPNPFLNPKPSTPTPPVISLLRREDAALAANFPPLSVLLAGLLVPAPRTGNGALGLAGQDFEFEVWSLGFEVSGGLRVQVGF